MATHEPAEHEQNSHTSESALPGERVAGELAQITRALVAIYKEQFGRGPRYAHTHYAGANGIVCFLEGSLTAVEQTLASLEEHQRLRDIRNFFQYTAESAFRSAVEEITGRSVVAFSSGIDVRADVATETFLLEPVAVRGETS